MLIELPNEFAVNTLCNLSVGTTDRRSWRKYILKLILRKKTKTFETFARNENWIIIIVFRDELSAALCNFIKRGGDGYRNFTKIYCISTVKKKCT